MYDLTMLSNIEWGQALPVSESLSALVLKGSAELFSKLLGAFAKRALETDREKIGRIKSNVTPHIEATFRKCCVIKTLLNPHTPADFLSIYATQRFAISNEPFDHYGMVDYIKRESHNLILTGAGGSGKSMFTRYLWLSLFVDSAGRIPLFVELRNINTISLTNIISYIHFSISQGQASLSEKDYEKYLNNGDFVLIFDGFDEVLQNKKDVIQQQIIGLAENYPKLKIIVTSRPDDRFASWPSFEVATVAPLKLEDVVELVEKAEFPQDSKAAFLTRLKSTDLFEKHNSFLTNPLLASMMLLTFSHKLDIPDRMHLFYEQAFDALYQRHDSYKPGGFKREFRTKLSEDVFKRVIAYFCLVTYFDEEFSFSRQEAISALKNAITLAGAEENASLLLDDMVSCVCFLILDGLQYTFSHRSFQEYFAAYCMDYVAPEMFEKFVSKFSKRFDDQVIMLLADMNPEALRRRYILPMAERFSKPLQTGVRHKSVRLYFENTKYRFTLRKRPMPRGAKVPIDENSTYISLDGTSDFLTYADLLNRLHEKEAAQKANANGAADGTRRARDERVAHAIFEKLNAPKDSAVSITARKGRFEYQILLDPRRRQKRPNDPEPVVSAEVDSIFEQSFMYEFVLNRMKIAGDYVTTQRRLEKSVSGAMAILLSGNRKGSAK